jgi:MFS family permease
MDFAELIGRISRGAAAGLVSTARWGAARVNAKVVDAVGGPARARVILLFGAVLALNTADASTVGAVAGQLEPDLHIGNTEVGLLSSVALIVGAIAAVPAGMLVDRVPRVRMLALSIVLWSVASAASGLGGEIAGTAVGFIISGTVAGILHWRAAFFLLALPGFWLARELWKTLPEPQRGGTSRLERGDVDLAAAARGREVPVDEEGAARDDELAAEAVQRRGVQPDPELVLHEDAARMSLRRAVPYVLRVRTNVELIISSALGYFFLAGLQTFAVVFIRGHYHTGQTTATAILGLIVVGALIGTLVSGPITDWLLRQGLLSARIWVPAISPLLFGAVADLVAGIAPEKAPIGTKPGGIEPGVARGLQVSFMLMLIALGAAGLILLRARQTYPRDVATAAASAEAQEEIVR